VARLVDLVQQVKDRMQHDPSLQAYDDAIIQVMNQHYLELSESEPWRFLQRTQDIVFYATVSGSSTATISIGVDANNRRKVVGSGTAFASTMEGHFFRGPDDNDYQIGKVSSATEMYLVDPYVTTSAVTGSEDWSIRFKRYLLPPDCAEPLGFVDRTSDRGKLLFIDRRKEEIDYLDADLTGDAVLVIEDDYAVLRPPFEIPTLTSGVSGTDLKSSTDYQYCYTFLYAGMESPPSPVAEITTGASDNVVTGANMEDTTWQDTTSFTALPTRMNKAVYRRDVTNGLPWLRVFERDDNAAGFIDDTLLPDLIEDYSHATYLQVQGTRMTVRAWHTPDSTDTISLRYLKRPRPMYADSDTPEWPETFHHVLVYRTLFDMYLQIGSPQAAVWERRAEARLKVMRAKWLRPSDRVYRRKSFVKDIVRERFENYGTPSRS